MLLTPVIQQFYTYYDAIVQAYSFNQLLALFFLISLMGWILETIYRSVSYKHLYNPGFLTGPIVPLYGNAGVFIMITIVFTREEPILIRLLIYFVAITLMEFVTGEVMLQLFKRRFWDYTDNALNVRGHICLPFSVAWAVLSLVFEQSIYPVSMTLVELIDNHYLMLMNGAGLLVMQVDFIYSLTTRNPIRLKETLVSLSDGIRQVLPLLSVRHLQTHTLDLKRRVKQLRQPGRLLTEYRKSVFRK